MYRLILIAAVFLAGCAPGATITPTIEPTASPTASPAPTPSPTVATGMPEFCHAIVELRQLGPLIQSMTGALTGDYDTAWTPAAQATLDQVKTISTALDAVPSALRFKEWKIAVLKIVLEVSEAIIQYDDGVRLGDVAAIQAGNDHLNNATDEIGQMNTLAAPLEAGCP